MLLALLGGASAVSSPPPPLPSPPPPAPPCTVAMLKQRPAGDKSWPVACSQVTLGTWYEDLDLSGAHLSYGDFQDATFQALYGSINLNGAGLAHADLSGSTLSAKHYGDATIDFAGADLTNADLSGSTLDVESFFGRDTTIDFAGADLTRSTVAAIERLPQGDKILCLAVGETSVIKCIRVLVMTRTCRVLVGK